MTEDRRLYAIKGHKCYWAPASVNFRAGFAEMSGKPVSADIQLFTSKAEAKKMRNILRKKYSRKGRSGKSIRVMDVTNDPKLSDLTSARLRQNVRY